MEARLQNALMRLPHERPMERITVRIQQHEDVIVRALCILRWLTVVLLLLNLVLTHLLLKQYREHMLALNA